MIALDTSAIVAIACSEPEEEAFNRLIALKEALVGTPTLLETRLVLESKLPEFADEFMEEFLDSRFIHPVAFSLYIYDEALTAFRRYGKGRESAAALNFGDCMAYAVAKAHDAPLLYKGNDFRRTGYRARPSMIPSFQSFRRVVLKVGSSLLVDRARGRLNHAWLGALAEDIAELHGRGADVLVVSSGAIALGRTVLGLSPGALRLEESQAAAAVGQIALARIWSEVLAHHGITAGQILLTLADTEERRRYLNARATTLKLLELRAVPVINENDTVATSEIRYGDNDRLAARVATMIGADLLVLFSDVDGLYTAPPAADPGARHIGVVERITPAIEAMAGGAGSDLSRGGMRTKIDAGKMATVGGTHMVIADGRRKNPLKAVAEGARCTWFLTPSNPVTARKGWIAGALEPRGTLVVDAGAARALAGGASLLPVGVRRVEGAFARGDAVVVSDGVGELGRGLVAYDAEEAQKIIGRASREIEDILGYPGRAEMIHRDDLALTQTLEAKVG